jgi:hypothetical protein
MSAAFIDGALSGFLLVVAFSLAVSIADSGIRAVNAWRALQAKLRQSRERGQ